MTEQPRALAGTPIAPPLGSATVATDELNRILRILRDVAPSDAIISFDFDGRLHAHIDLRHREAVTVLEAVLPAVGQGLFRSLTRAATPQRPFFHRLSFLVAA